MSVQTQPTTDPQSHSAQNHSAYTAWAIDVLNIEAQAITTLAQRLKGEQGDVFGQAVQALLQCQGRVVLIGVGKSGLIAKKIAATLASTGTPAFFVHATEASHGDLGVVTAADVIIALSNSGATEELVAILPAIARRGAAIIALTGNPSSALAQQANWVLNCAVAQEACPLNLAPTASTTAALAMGDALAVAVLQARGFTEADFALSHPAGSLGRKLILRVSDIMRQGQAVPKVHAHQPVTEAILEMTNKGLGMTAVVGEHDFLLGVFTDGDLRRLIEQGLDPRQVAVSQVMNATPKTILPERLAVEAVHLMEVNRVSQLLVANPEHQVVGALNFHDLFQAKVV